MKLKRGQKLCPKCGEVQAARQCECKHCGYQMRQRKNKTQTVHDWTELEKGDFIKVFQGTGSYYLNSCLLYTSPSPRDVEESRMPSSA